MIGYIVTLVIPRTNYFAAIIIKLICLMTHINRIDSVVLFKDSLLYHWA